MTPIHSIAEPKPAVAASSGLPTEAGLSLEAISGFRRRFDERPANRLAQNALAATPAADVALDRRIANALDESFSIRLDDWKATNQRKSGRCWMFAALNLLRVGAMRKMNLEDFEFSQTWTLFWDKLERANWFLEAIIATADRPLDDRTVAFLLDRPLDDGGQWNMAVAIIRKHGLVPKSAMPETHGSSNTQLLNRELLRILRESARELRTLRAHGAPMEAARAAKIRTLETVHRVLAIHLGTPPDRVDWQWRDRTKAFRREGALTPREFAERFVTVPLEEYVCLVHDPRAASPFGRTFTVEHLGNVVDGPRVVYLNLEIGAIKRIAQRTLEQGEPVWFGCDVGQAMHRDLGIWDPKLFDWQGLHDHESALDKAARLEYHDTLMTHAMLFTGVDVADGRPRRWRVENSWGDEVGRKGFFTMSDGWFDEHVFEIAAHRRFLEPAQLAALEQEPIVLPPWDPMGALA